MPVYQLANEMPYDEFVRWVKYLEKRPVEWRDDLRTAQLMRTFGDKRPPDEIFPTLKFIRNQSSDLKSSLKSSALFQKMLSAKNGDQLQVLENL